MDRVWLRPPFNSGEPKEVDATPEVIVPLLVAGWTQCEPPAGAGQEEVAADVHD